MLEGDKFYVWFLLPLSKLASPTDDTNEAPVVWWIACRSSGVETMT